MNVLFISPVDTREYIEAMAEALAEMGISHTIATPDTGLTAFLTGEYDAVVIDKCEISVSHRVGEYWEKPVQCFFDIKASLAQNQKVFALGFTRCDLPEYIELPTTPEFLRAKIVGDKI